ncbi:hypothetical protein SAMN05216524_104457 [Mucilaginibacter sp. OK098]|nr:hypothetical protein SAMN05216524_104457 [Mucilaginibacter sp. OK098]
MFFNWGGVWLFFIGETIKLQLQSEEKINYHKMVSFFNSIKHHLTYCVSSVI